jgi:hypothetical protein
MMIDRIFEMFRRPVIVSLDCFLEAPSDRFMLSVIRGNYIVAYGDFIEDFDF